MTTHPLTYTLFILTTTTAMLAYPPATWLMMIGIGFAWTLFAMIKAGWR